MRIHADQQRAEMFDAESPQAFGMKVVEIDIPRPRSFEPGTRVVNEGDVVQEGDLIAVIE